MRDFPTPVILGGLAAATALLRLPLLTPRLAHWDAVNYALGLHHFDIAAHQPHPPGSPYFIALGRVALALVGDDNAALQLVSVTASVGAVLAEYLLARKVFGRSAALLAALLLMTQPIFWGYGTTASAWTLLAFLAIGIAWSCLLLRDGRRRWLPSLSALALGVASGFRADAAVFLAPLWLWALFGATPRWRDRVLAIGVAGWSALLWIVPVVVSAGGPSAWGARLLALLPSADSSLDAELRQLAADTVISFGTLALVIGLPIALGLLGGWSRARCWWRSTLRTDKPAFWGLAIVPGFTFLWLIDSTEPGHNLVFIGALVALGAGIVAHSAPSRAVLAAYAAVLVVAQTCLFLFVAPMVNRPLAWTADSMLLNVTAVGLRQQQTSLDAALTTIHSRFDPRTTLVVTVIGQDAYRFMMYYVPEFAVVRVDDRLRAVLVARDRQQGNWTQTVDCASTSEQAHEVVWVLSRPFEPGTIPADASRLSEDADGGVFEVWSRTMPASGLEYLGVHFARGGCITS